MYKSMHSNNGAIYIMCIYHILDRMSNHPNPFRPGSGTMPPFLAGRDYHFDVFKRMLEDASSGYSSNMLLVGLRGVGKSTLVERFSEIAKEKGFAVVIKSQFNKKHSIPELFIKALRYDVDGVISDLSKTKRIAKRVRKAANLAKPKKMEFMGVTMEPSYDTDSMLVENEMKEYLSACWPVFEKAGLKGVIFLFDEFHEVSNLDIKTGTILSDFIGVLNDLQKDGIGYYAVLAGLPNLEMKIKKAKTYTERMFFTTKVENLSEADARNAIIEPLKETSVSFSNSLINSIIEETGRYPYFIQFYGREIISNVDKRRISIMDFKKIRDQIRKNLDNSFFDRRFADTSDTEKKILFAMSMSDSEEIDMKTIKKSGIVQGTLAKSLIRLERKGLVHRCGYGKYRLSLPLLGEYLQRIRPRV